uniref:triacylglycerol lipase n=2 Tax=Clastoptera arizonana TaxID=38151 RepID=A0A1B6BZU4_9HEMI
MTNTNLFREPNKCCRPVNRRRKINLSFAGCGFNGIYHVGVAVCLKKYAPHLLLNRISGASAGAIAACYLLCDLPVSSVTSDVLELVRLARKRTLGPFSPTFNVQDVLEQGLRKNLPEDAHLRVSGKLHISLTQLPGFRNVIVSRFYSKEDLIRALLASSFVPFFSGSHPPKFNGGYYMDGGFSNNLPTLDENTITVSPFCGETDICPRDDSSQLFHVNFANTSIEVSKQNVHRIIRILYPPKPEVLTKMCMQGFEDTLRFLHNNNMIKCAQYIAVESTFLVSSKLDDDTEEIEHDPECKDCLRQRQEAIGATLPESVRAIFQEAVDAANKGLVNWLFRIPGMKILSFLALPYTLPFEIVYATITKFLIAPPHMPNNFLSMCEFIMDQLEHFMNIKSEPSTECVACTCHLQDTEYCGMGTTKEAVPDMTIHSQNDISFEIIIENEKEEFLEPKLESKAPSKDKHLITQPSLGHNRVEHYADDTFENILLVTAHHEALMTFYYLDEKNKMKIAEIFEVTEDEANILGETDDTELESSLIQHTEEGKDFT